MNRDDGRDVRSAERGAVIADGSQRYKMYCGVKRAEHADNEECTEPECNLDRDIVGQSPQGLDPR